jgi:hypothetical protein
VEKIITRSLMSCDPHQILFGEMHTGFWWENLRERDHLEDTDVVGKVILK